MKWLTVLLILVAPVSADETVRFNRDVRPILASHCFPCHGPDSQARQGGLRLDLRDEATAATASGARAIVPGDPAASALIQRILSTDPDTVMPPPTTGKPLTTQQQQTLQQWIATGAEYERHWSYIAPTRPPIPALQDTDWPANEIDAFVLARLEREELRPSPRAENATLLRRVSLDLTGLPPTDSDAARMLQRMDAAEREDMAAERPTTARRDEEFEAWVSQFLSSPHHGERMAVDWLDAARFADTNGYQVDRDRDLSAWRDWVIGAFSLNMPFDQFTIEQLAGDLLPEASLSQRIATGFHRNHMLNEEGGVIPEEFLAEYCADRVETTATIWLGQTFNCCRCHDHKFDPFTQRDYYSLLAFFHNINESGLGNYGADIRRNAPPFLKLPAPELVAQLAALQTELSLLQQRLQPAAAATPASGSAAHGTEPDTDRAALEKRLAELTKQLNETELRIPTTLVMEELSQPRETRILIRGAYNQPGSPVTADTPERLPPMAPDFPRNRLGLARWLTDPRNPLPARVTVNRLWQSLWGAGLVRSTEDFGTQGDLPEHPELLDWLADEFVRSGWDLRHLLRLMVSSRTYQQSSRLTPELRQRDPDNRLLARGARFRLQAEFLRDQALLAGGLLVPRIGGPAVRPYHPPGLYEQVTAGGTGVYVVGSGDELYRRSMYSYWKRSVPHPGMLVFDAPFRESCTLRRARTNTPLQALNLMNDPTYLEAARCLAERMLQDAGSDMESQLTKGFRLVLVRDPRQAELQILLAAGQRALLDFQKDPGAAREFLTVGARQPARDFDPVRLAALTTVAGTILNLDETVMKE